MVKRNNKLLDSRNNPVCYLKIYFLLVPQFVLHPHFFLYLFADAFVQYSNRNITRHSLISSKEKRYTWFYSKKQLYSAVKMYKLKFKHSTVSAFLHKVKPFELSKTFIESQVWEYSWAKTCTIWSRTGF